MPVTLDGRPRQGTKNRGSAGPTTQKTGANRQRGHRCFGIQRMADSELGWKKNERAKPRRVVDRIPGSLVCAPSIEEHSDAPSAIPSYASILNAARPSGSPLRTGVPCSIRHQRTHHVVLFMLEDVAVPDVLFPASPRTHRIPHGCGWQVWQVELHDDSRDLTRVHAHRILPPDFIRIGWHGPSGKAPIPRIPAERLALNQLHVHQVKVNGMRVAREIHDLPHFGRTGFWIFR